jgi:protocatechuate 3,4-dioxygenase beta subunit
MPVKMFLPPEIRTDGTVEVNYAQTYYPNSRTEKGAGRVEVQAGAEIGGIGIQLVRAPIVGVSGTVAGMPRGAERMMIEMRQGWSVRGGGAVKEDGTFQIWRLDPGKYTITGTWNSNGQRMRTAPVEIEVAQANIEHIELRVIPPSDIAGHVEFEDEKAKQPPQPPQGRLQTNQQTSQQTIPPKPPPLRLNVSDASGGPSPQPVMVGEDGSFRLEGLPPGRYRLIPAWGAVYVKSMRLGQTAIDGNLLDLTNGSAGAALSVLVSSATGEISGTVSDDKGPVAGVRVALLQADAEGFTFPRLAATGEDGSYRLTGIAPGKYKLAAGGETDFQTLQALEPDDDSPVELVEVHAADKLTRDLKQRPPS